MLGNNRKTIAVFTSLPSAFYQGNMCNELSKRGNSLGYNVVSYVNFGSYDTSNKEYAIGEKSIIYLPDYNELDGVVILSDCLDVPGMLDELIAILKQHPKLPVVSVRGRLPDFHSVILNESQALDVIFDHILGVHKYKKVYYVSGTKGREDAEARLSSYRRKMKEYGLEYSEDWIFHGNFWTTLGPKMADWIEEQGLPEAVVCANDYMAISLIDELEHRGYRIPEDLVVTGFDDIDKASYNDISLTTVRVAQHLFADKAIEVLHRLIQGQEVDMISYIDVELIIRGSCGCHEIEQEDSAVFNQNMYFRYESSIISNELNLYFARAAQNKKDLDSVMKSGAYYSDMISDYKSMYFAINESGEYGCYPDISTFKYTISNNQLQNENSLEFPRGELFPLEDDGQAKRLYVVPLHHEDDLYGYVGLDTGDDKPVGIFFPNFLVTVTNSIERILQDKNVKEHIEKEKEARYMAEKASTVKDDFLVNFSHEVRTPLNTIIGMTDLLFDEALSEEGEEYLASIKYAGDNLLRMIGDILDYCQLNAGTLKIRQEHYRTDALCNDIEKMMEMFCRKKTDVAYSVAMATDVPEKLLGDKERIEQIMVNLCSNAAKFTHKGRIKAVIKWKQSTDSETEGNLILSVLDTGIGIAKEDIDSLFDAFKQIDPARNRLSDGNGMGLTVCNMLVKVMDGDIHIDSIPGKGSCFTVTIPQVVGEAVRRKTVKKNTVIDGVSGSTVLIVDDNRMNLKVEGLLLGKYGVKVLCATSGQEAIDMLEKDDSIDLVFMDYMMPGMDGAEATRIIRSKGMELPIIAVTANTISGATDIYYEAGMSDYLPKPIDIHKLEEILKRWIAGAED